jgi:hypothetical protein
MEEFARTWLFNPSVGKYMIEDAKVEPAVTPR